MTDPKSLYENYRSKLGYSTNTSWWHSRHRIRIRWHSTRSIDLDCWARGACVPAGRIVCLQDGRRVWRRDLARSNPTLLIIRCILGQIACDLLQAQASGRLLPVQHVSVLVLLLLLKIAHLGGLLSHHFIALLCLGHLGHFVLHGDLFLHSLLT